MDDAASANQQRPNYLAEILSLCTTFTSEAIDTAGGKAKVTDGPFTEAKEVVGGYWMIQVKSREEAIEWASRCPGDDCIVEVRQVQEFSDFPADVQEASAGFPELQSEKRSMA